MVGLCATRHYVLVHLVVGGFGQVDALQHCWEGSVVDRLPTVDYGLVFGVDYF